jgi:hypothetical protein
MTANKIVQSEANPKQNGREKLQQFRKSSMF